MSSEPPHSPTSRQTTGPAVLRRLLHINARLHEGRRITAASLAEELEVSSRTIKRDIATLRDEHGVDITWEPSTGTYFSTTPSERLPLLRLGAGPKAHNAPSVKHWGLTVAYVRAPNGHLVEICSPMP